MTAREIIAARIRDHEVAVAELRAVLADLDAGAEEPPGKESPGPAACPTPAVLQLPPPRVRQTHSVGQPSSRQERLIAVARILRETPLCSGDLAAAGIPRSSLTMILQHPLVRQRRKRTARALLPYGPGEGSADAVRFDPGPERVHARARHRDPLTPEQQALVLSCSDWLKAEVCWCAPLWLRAAVGFDHCVQEGWFAVIKAAHDFDPVKYPNVPFGAFARLGVRKHFMGVRTKTGTKSGVWVAMPVNDEGYALDPEDHRGCEVHPALRAWCDPDYRAQRACLTMRQRVVLYLRCVEGWTLGEIGEVLGVSKERVRQLEEAAVVKLARFRNRERLRRQLSGRGE